MTDPSKLVPPVITGSEDYCNDYGAIRNCFVRAGYFTQKLSKNDVVDLYREWRDDPEYFILRGITQNPLDQQRIIRGPEGCYDNWYLENDIDFVYKFIKASKRGNDVYKHLVQQKLKPLKELYDVFFFDDDDADKRTCMLFVTLTYDSKRCGSDAAWNSIGDEFHLFHNNLRKQFGKVEVFRTWESTSNFYPHVHALILFWDQSFPVLEHHDKNGEISYRIPFKIKEKISGYWHSNVDVQALQDTTAGIKELVKYITKDLCSNKGDKTNAMIWLHRKQSYAISKGFVEAITGWNIDFNEPSNTDLINQMCNCNQDVVEWEFIGILRGKQLGFDGSMWCVDTKKPPPRVVDLIILEYNRWRELHGGRC